jgi:uncharacterized protein
MAPKLIDKPKINERYAAYKLAVRKSKIHRYGLFAAEDIPANRKVIEYTGEKLNRKQSKDRGTKEITYLFALNDYWTLDGAVGGSGAEIINHCCDPNLISRIMKGHILYMSLRKIRKGEELSIDYNFAKSSGDRTPCKCGAKDCRGIMEK